MLAWQGHENVNPSKCYGRELAKASRLYIFGKVIQDHIESIGKPILLKGNEVLIMTQLLKCLVILLQNPQPPSPNPICPNPKSLNWSHQNSTSGPTELILDRATATP